MNHSEEIMKMLKIKPYEKFHIDLAAKEEQFFINDNLAVYKIIVKDKNTQEYEYSDVSQILHYLLTGVYKIIKDNNFQIEMLKSIRKLGRSWLARDKNNKLYAYSVEPEKYNTFWTSSRDDDKIFIKEDIFGFSDIEWEDKLAFYINQNIMYW